MAPVKVGDKLSPDTPVWAQSAGGGTTLGALFGGKRVVLVGFPGAFTGTCTGTHLPTFVDAWKDGSLKAAGFDACAALAPDTGPVMTAWGEATGATAAGLEVLGDANQAYMKAVGLGPLDWAEHFMGPGRMSRHAIVLDDLTVTWTALEDGGACTKSLAADVIAGAGK